MFRWPVAWGVYVFLVLAAVAVVTPPWQASDEPLHLARAVELAHGEVLGWRQWRTAGGTSDHAIYEAYLPVRPVAMHPAVRPVAAALAESRRVRWSPTLDFVSFPNTVQYPPFFYLPDIAGYWLARAAGMRIDASLIVCRLANAAAFAGLGALALLLAARTRWMLAALLLLPMTLSLGASAAQDGPMIGALAVAVALVDRAGAAGRCSGRVLACVAALLAAVGMARPPYAGFLLVLLAMPHRRRFLAAGAGAAAVAAWCAIVAARVMVRLGGADAGQQVALLAAHPGQIPGLVARTFRAFALDYWLQFVGRLGWTDTAMPGWYYVFATLALVAPVLAVGRAAPRRPWLAALGAGFAVVAIFVLQYVTWSWPGQDLITGVLGRYFIPVALVLALAVPRVGFDAAAAGRWAVGAMAVVTPPAMIATLLARYAVR